MSRQADVVVPVYADVEGTVRCLESVLRHSEGQLRRLLIIDDLSPDPRMPAALEELRLRAPDRILVLRNEQNLGFVGSANRGLALRGGDVVLLNSDTEVTSGWLTELFAALDSSPFVAAAVPLSNNATLCSVPMFCGVEDAEILRAGDLQLAAFPAPTTEMPTGVGFCMLLRHTALEMVGLFDPVFGRGYNEENDWCMRARRAGFSILRANRALVFHLGGASFGEEKSALDRRNARVLSQRHPEYLEENRAFAQGPTAHRAAGYVAHRLGRARVSLEGADAWGTAALSEALGHWVVGAGQQPELVHWRGSRLDLAEAARLSVLTSALIVDGPEPWALGGSVADPQRRRELGLWHLILSIADAVIAPTRAAAENLLRTFHLPSERVRVVPPLAEGAVSEVLRGPSSQGAHWLLLGEPGLAPLDAMLTTQALLRARLGADAPVLVTAWPEAWGPPVEGVLPLPPGAGAMERLATLAGALVAVAPGPRGCAAREVAAAMKAGVPVLASAGWGASELLGEGGGVLESHSPEALAREVERLARDPAHPRTLAAALAPRLTSAAEVAERLQALYGWALEHPDPSLLARRVSTAQVLGSL